MALQSLLGVVALILAAWAFSERRGAVAWRTVAIGLGLQFTIAVLFLKVPASKRFFLYLNEVVLALEGATRAGTSFVFGYLGGGDPPFEVIEPSFSYILAFRALPLLLLMSALATLLFYWRILPLVVRSFSWVLQKTLGIGGAEGVGVAGNIFLGMVESPLFIRPYLNKLTRSELFTVMVSGMATIAGTVMVLYASILSDTIPDVLGHILTASIVNAPGAIVVAKLLIPETQPLTPGTLEPPQEIHNSMDAITKGTLQGVQLLLNIVAMLIVIIALVYLINVLLTLLPWGAEEPLTLELLFGWMMAPVVWLIGIPWSDAVTAGSLMGTKTIVNELVAYLQMSNLPENALSPRSSVIMTYAMCGFANPGSLGIMIGGLGTLAAERRGEVVELGLRSILAGTLTTLLTGAIVATLI